MRAALPTPVKGVQKKRRSFAFVTWERNQEQCTTQNQASEAHQDPLDRQEENTHDRNWWWGIILPLRRLPRVPALSSPRCEAESLFVQSRRGSVALLNMQRPSCLRPSLYDSLTRGISLSFSLSLILWCWARQWWLLNLYLICRAVSSFVSSLFLLYASLPTRGLSWWCCDAEEWDDVSEYMDLICTIPLLPFSLLFSCFTYANTSQQCLCGVMKLRIR